MVARFELRRGAEMLRSELKKSRPKSPFDISSPSRERMQNKLTKIKRTINGSISTIHDSFSKTRPLQSPIKSPRTRANKTNLQKQNDKRFNDILRKVSRKVGDISDKAQDHESESNGKTQTENLSRIPTTSSKSPSLATYKSLRRRNEDDSHVARSVVGDAIPDKIAATSSTGDHTNNTQQKSTIKIEHSAQNEQSLEIIDTGLVQYFYNRTRVESNVSSSTRNSKVVGFKDDENALNKENISVVSGSCNLIMECKSEETKDTRSYDETIFLNMNLWETEEDNMEVIDSVLINKYEERTKQITRFEPRSRSSISLVTGVGNINVRESKSEETHKSDETDDTESVVMEEKTIESPSKVRVEKRQKRTPASPWQAKLKNMLLGLRNNGMKKDKRPAQAMPSENVFEPERGIHLGDSFACSTLTNVFGSYLDQEEEEKARDANFPPDNNITSVPYPKKSRLDLEDYEAVAEMYERVVNQCKNFNKGSVVQKPYVPKYKSMSTRGGHLEYESDIPYDEANDILIDEALTRETSDQKFEKVAQMLKEKIKPEHTELPPEPKICEKPKTDTVADVLKLESSRKTNDCMDIRIATGGKQRKAMVDMKKRVRRKTPSPPNCTDNSVPSIRENDAMYCITPLPTVHEPLTEGLLHECKLVEGNSFDIEVGSGSNIDVYSTKVSSDKSTVVSVKKSSSSKSADLVEEETDRAGEMMNKQFKIHHSQELTAYYNGDNDDNWNLALSKIDSLKESRGSLDVGMYDGAVFNAESYDDVSHSVFTRRNSFEAKREKHQNNGRIENTSHSFSARKAHGSETRNEEKHDSIESSEQSRSRSYGTEKQSGCSVIEDRSRCTMIKNQNRCRIGPGVSFSKEKNISNVSSRCATHSCTSSYINMSHSVFTIDKEHYPKSRGKMYLSQSILTENDKKIPQFGVIKKDYFDDSGTKDSSVEVSRSETKIPHAYTKGTRDTAYTKGTRDTAYTKGTRDTRDTSFTKRTRDTIDREFNSYYSLRSTYRKEYQKESNCCDYFSPCLSDDTLFSGESSFDSRYAPRRSLSTIENNALSRGGSGYSCSTTSDYKMCKSPFEISISRSELYESPSRHERRSR